MKKQLLLAISLAAAGAAHAQDTTASATLRDAQGQPAGQATFTPDAKGLQIKLEAERLSPGQHGFHVHEKGECAPGPDAAGKTIAFGAAGPHFDPSKTGQHAGPEHDGHAGDLPNVKAGADGRGQVTFTSRHLGLTGASSVIGRTLVVHEKADDYQSNPAGNSGGRVLCGVIEAGAAKR